MINVNVSGTWKTVKYCYVNVSGTWKTVGQIQVNVSGTWKSVWSYSWSTGSWGTCSKTCGTGTQTRTVQCKRNDGQIVLDSLCTKYVGTKPATSQNCNTQSCETCLTKSYTSSSTCSSLPMISSVTTGWRIYTKVTSNNVVLYWQGTAVASNVTISNATSTGTTYTTGGYKYKNNGSGTNICHSCFTTCLGPSTIYDICRTAV